LVDLLATLEIDPFTAALAELAGDVYRQLASKGRAPPSYDLLIASHALLRDIPMATGDLNYGAIPGLQLIQWSAADRTSFNESA
jgi:predicted nucleic acid-binding protein